MEGIVYFGGFGRNEYNFYSDLDVFIYLSPDEIEYSRSKERVKEFISRILLNDEESISLDFEINGKWVLFTTKTFIKVEIGIKIVSEAKDDVIFIVESKISRPEQAIVYDKTGRIKQIYSENWIVLNDDDRLKKLFIEDAHKFIYYFDYSMWFFCSSH